MVVALADFPALFFYSWVGQSTRIVLLIKRSGSLQHQWCFKIALGAPWLAPHNVCGSFTTSLGCILVYCVCILMYSGVHSILVYYVHLMMLANFTNSYYVVHTGVLCVHSDVFWCAYWCIMYANFNICTLLQKPNKPKFRSFAPSLIGSLILPICKSDPNFACWVKVLLWNCTDLFPLGTKTGSSILTKSCFCCEFKN